MEDGIPEDETLRQVAQAQLPGLPGERVEEWLVDFRFWLAAPAIQEALTRASYPGEVRVEQEMPFLHRQSDGLLHGFIDRLVVFEKGDVVVGAEVLDFKTDLLDGTDADAVAAKVEYYRPQMEAYREAAAGLFGLERECVSGKLLFLRPGLVRKV
jgi:ATP-dependent exoDNAse (exonuclease V) beta subunit